MELWLAATIPSTIIVDGVMITKRTSKFRYSHHHAKTKWQYALEIQKKCDSKFESHYKKHKKWRTYYPVLRMPVLSQLSLGNRHHATINYNIA